MIYESHLNKFILIFLLLKIKNLNILRIHNFLRCTNNISSQFRYLLSLSLFFYLLYFQNPKNLTNFHLSWNVSFHPSANNIIQNVTKSLYYE